MTHAVTAIIYDHTLPTTKGPEPMLVQYEVADWGDAMDQLRPEYGAQHRGGKMIDEADLEIVAMTIMRKD